MNTITKTFLMITALAALPISGFAKEKKPPALAVAWKDVPPAVQKAIQDNAAGGKVKEVRKETVNGVLYYYAEVKGTDGNWTKLYVNGTGAFLKAEPDKARNKRKHKPLFG
jgi:hypothetical protein